MVKLEFTLNGEKRKINVEANDILLDVLRVQLGMKSVKCGCARGDCGSCSILLNGKSIRSCLILAVETNEQDIVTVEGLSKEKLTPLQEAFIEQNAFQCGFCAPGIVIAATELLNNNPHPSREEIQESLAGNLCRCTGYSSIIDTILKVSKEEK